MTIKVTVTHNEPGSIHNIIVRKDNGNIHEVGVVIEPCKSADFYVWKGQKLIIEEQE